ncbi:hypothetical protein ACFXAZ_25420 [Streptomyces sp. NPDC059477]|uniref:hypothetical protein n=1 Tax=Streptomyces sp. NPDC059477 TaxID=3346847 RepID=UPI0036953829
MDNESERYTAFRRYPRAVAMPIAHPGFTPETAEDAATEAMAKSPRRKTVPLRDRRVLLA